MTKPTSTTIVYPIYKDQVLLGMKKRGFGAGWWNGFGGKLEPGESFKENARRETFEESGIVVESLNLAALLLFHFGGKLKIVTKAFISTTLTGKPVETEEMKPKWFSVNALPYESMWPSDNIWVPKALKLSTTAEMPSYCVYFTADNKLLDFKPIKKSEAQQFFNLS